VACQVEFDPRGVAITRDGAFAYVSNRISNDVSVVSTASNTCGGGQYPQVLVALLPEGVAIKHDPELRRVLSEDQAVTWGLTSPRQESERLENLHASIFGSIGCCPGRSPYAFESTAHC